MIPLIFLTLLRSSPTYSGNFRTREGEMVKEAGTVGEVVAIEEVCDRLLLGEDPTDDSGRGACPRPARDTPE